MKSSAVVVSEWKKDLIIVGKRFNHVIDKYLKTLISEIGKGLMLFCLLTLSVFVANAHCYDVPMYSKTYVVSDTVTDNYTDSSIRFNCSGTTIFTPATNFTNWNSYYFNGNLNIQGSINFPAEAGSIRFYGNVVVTTMLMNKNDTIHADGGTLDIINLTSDSSKSGQYNVIYTNSYVTISGTAYYPGDTFYSTLSNKETAVLITDCRGVSLPLQVLEFTAEVKNECIWLNWKLAYEEIIVTLQYSTGIGWEDVCQIQGSALYKFSRLNRNNIFRLKAGSEYSGCIYRQLNTVTAGNDSEEVYTDTNGRKVTSLISGNIYIIHFKNGTKFKFQCTI